ncbi:MAG: tetratricopeptide repeat protein [Candidatus Omnitrophica bacterium]|nr:tetratricopeptide repeat protein [Candidatus Omnitrophota bacterium]
MLWKRLNYFFGLFPLVILFGVLVCAANLEVKDLDLWLHLAMGKFITLHHFVPDFDVLSCTITGKPWINHEWLFQVLAYNIYKDLGADGLLRMQIVLVSLTMFFLLLIGYNKNRLLLTNFFLIIVFMVYQYRFTLRPDLFSLLFFAVYIFILALHIDKKWSLGVLFFVQVLWTNMHGFFFFGPLFVLIGIFSEWMKRHVPLPYEWDSAGRLTDEEYGRLKKILIIVIFACFFNPSVVEGALYPLRVFFSLSGENKIFFQYIQELQRPVTMATLWDSGQMGYFKLSIFLSFLTFIFNRRNIDISALLLWIIFLAFSLIAIRNIPFFAFTAYLVSITNLLNINASQVVPLRFSDEKFKYITLIMLHLIFAAGLFRYGQAMVSKYYYDLDTYERKAEFGGGVTTQGFPHKAVVFLKKNNIKGNFFNDFNSGAYLLGNVYPNIRVFIDGRTEVYGGKFFLQYNKMWKDGNVQLFEKAVSKYHLTGALMNSARQHIPKNILKYIYKSKDWTLVYFGDDGAIFLKNIPQNKAWIDKFRIDLTKWQPPKVDLFRIGEQATLPFQNYDRAFTLESLGLNDQALLELKDGLKISPNYFQSYELLGKIYAQKKQYQQAFEYFRIASAMVPSDKEGRFNLALAYLDLGQYPYAIDQYKKLTRFWSDDMKGFFFLAKAYIKNKQYDKALEVLKQIYPKKTRSYKDILALVDLMCRQGAYSRGKELYSYILSVESKNKQSKSVLKADFDKKYMIFKENKTCNDVCSDAENSN